MTILTRSATVTPSDADAALAPIYGESIETLAGKSKEDLLPYVLQYRKEKLDARVKAKDAYLKHKPVIAARKQLKAAINAKTKAERKADAAEATIKKLKGDAEAAHFESLINELVET